MPGRENCYDSPRCFDRKIGHFYPSFLPLPHIQPKHTCTYIHITEYIHGLHLHTAVTVSPPCGGGGNY